MRGRTAQLEISEIGRDVKVHQHLTYCNIKSIKIETEFNIMGLYYGIPP